MAEVTLYLNLPSFENWLFFIAILFLTKIIVITKVIHKAAPRPIADPAIIQFISESINIKSIRPYNRGLI